MFGFVLHIVSKILLILISGSANRSTSHEACCGSHGCIRTAFARVLFGQIRGNRVAAFGVDQVDQGDQSDHEAYYDFNASFVSQKHCRGIRMPMLTTVGYSDVARFRERRSLRSLPRMRFAVWEEAERQFCLPPQRHLARAPQMQIR